MKKILTSLVVFSFLFLIATPVLAFPSLIPDECREGAPLEGCKSCPLDQESRAGCCCDLSSVERTAVNVSQIILGVAGSVALVIFVIGGVIYITSGGSSDKVQKATSLLKGAVVGLAIILLAGLIIQTILTKLTA
jgi:hypothetical protein